MSPQADNHVMRGASIKIRPKWLSFLLASSLLVFALWTGVRISAAIHATIDRIEELHGNVQPRGLEAQPALLHPRFPHMNDTHGYFNTTSTVHVNGTVIATVTEKQTLTAVATVTETATSEEVVSGAALRSDGADRMTVTEFQTHVVTATAVVSEDGDASVTRVYNSTTVLTLTHTDLVTSEYISTVTRFVEPIPFPPMPTVSDPRESDTVIEEISSIVENESYTSTLTLTTTEHIYPGASESSDDFNAQDDIESEGESSTTTTTYTPTVYKTQTVTETPAAADPSTIESTLTTIRTATIEATNTVVVTETADPEHVCHDEVHYITVTFTATASETKSTTSDALGQPGEPIMTSSEALKTLSVTQTITLSGPFVRTSTKQVDQDTEVQVVTQTQTNVQTETKIETEVETQVETQVKTKTQVVETSPSMTTLTLGAEETTSTEILIFTQTQTHVEIETKVESQVVESSISISTLTLGAQEATSAEILVVTQTQTHVEIETKIESQVVESSISISTLTLGGEKPGSTQIVELTDIVTVTQVEDQIEEATEIMTVTATRTQVASEIQTVTIHSTEEPAITFTEVETKTQTTGSPLAQSSPLIGQEVSTLTELVSTEMIPVTQYLAQTITEFVTYTTVTTIDGAEIEQPVTEADIHTEVVTQVEIVTITRTQRANATAVVTATRTVPWASGYTVASALASAGNATWTAPKITASHVEVSGADTAREGKFHNAALGMVLAVFGLMVLF